MPDLQRLGKYEIRGTLGRGAMGTVFRAFDPDIERLVALKTIRLDHLAQDDAANFRLRFRNEAKAAGRLHHANIVGVYEYGEDHGNAFIAMEYVDGTELGQYVAGGPGLGVRQSVELLAQLLAALEFAHGFGVIHRDIKPSNLIVTHDGVVKVADFGIARGRSGHRPSCLWTPIPTAYGWSSLRHSRMRGWSPPRSRRPSTWRKGPTRACSTRWPTTSLAAGCC